MIEARSNVTKETNSKSEAFKSQFRVPPQRVNSLFYVRKTLDSIQAQGLWALVRFYLVSFFVMLSKAKIEYLSYNIVRKS